MVKIRFYKLVLQLLKKIKKWYMSFGGFVCYYVLYVWVLRQGRGKNTSSLWMQQIIIEIASSLPHMAKATGELELQCTSANFSTFIFLFCFVLFCFVYYYFFFFYRKGLGVHKGLPATTVVTISIYEPVSVTTSQSLLALRIVQL